MWGWATLSAGTVKKDKFILTKYKLRYMVGETNKSTIQNLLTVKATLA